NKWGDCIFLRVPFIVNEEVETAAPFVSGGGAWSVPYANVERLVELLMHLSKNRSQVSNRGQALAQFSDEFAPFDLRFVEAIKTFTDETADALHLIDTPR